MLFHHTLFFRHIYFSATSGNFRHICNFRHIIIFRHIFVRAHGVPPWTKIAAELGDIKKLLKKLPETIREVVSTVLDEKGVASGNVTQDMLDKTLTKAMDSVFARCQAAFDARRPAAAPVVQQPRADQDNTTGFTLFRWECDNKFHRLPQDYVLSARATVTSATVIRTPQQAYFRWYLPDLTIPVPALRFTDCYDYNKNQRNLFCEWKCVTNRFDQYLLEAGPNPFNNRQHPTAEELSQRYSLAIKIHNEMVQVYHPDKRRRVKRRNGDIAKRVSTVYHELRKMTPYVKKAKKLLILTRALLPLQRQCKAITV